MGSEFQKQWNNIRSHRYPADSQAVTKPGVLYWGRAVSGQVGVLWAAATLQLRRLFFAGVAVSRNENTVHQSSMRDGQDINQKINVQEKLCSDMLRTAAASVCNNSG
jgi:hypothetical protein